MKQADAPYRRIAELSPSGMQLLGIVLLLSFSAYLTSSIHDPSVYWNIAIGQWITAQRTVPLQNHFTVIGDSLPWISLSWLYDVLVAELDRRWGMVALVCLKFLLITILLLLLSLSFSRIAHSNFLAGILVVMLGAGLFARSKLTPELLGLIVVVAFIESLNRMRSRSMGSIWFIVFCPLAILSANLYLPSVLTALVLLIFLLLYHAVVGRELFVTKQRTILVFVVLLFSLVITPYRGDNVLFALTSGVNAVIQAWPERVHWVALLDYRVAILLLLAAPFVFAAYTSDGRTRLKSVNAQFLLLLLVAVWCKPLANFALLAAGYRAAMTLSKGSAVLAGVSIGLDKLYRLLVRLPAFGSFFLSACVFYVSLQGWLRHPVSHLLLPFKEVSLVQELIKKGEHIVPVYHPAELGGYVLYSLRTENIRAGFASQLFTAYPKLFEFEQSLRNSDSGWERYFRERLAPRAAIVYRGSALAKTLRAHADWCAVSSPGSTDFELYLARAECPNIAQ